MSTKRTAQAASDRAPSNKFNRGKPISRLPLNRRDDLAPVRVALQSLLNEVANDGANGVAFANAWDSFCGAFPTGTMPNDYSLDSRGMPDTPGVEALIRDSMALDIESKDALAAVIDMLPDYWHAMASSESTPKHAPARRLREVIRSALAILGDAPISTTRAERSEGEKAKPNATTEAILPSLLSASDIATRINRQRKSVTSFLTRYAEKHPDCRVENPSKRRTEPSYLYRTTDVWPALENWIGGNGRRLKRD